MGKGGGRWSYPNPGGKGMVWWGTKPATKGQIAIMKRHVIKNFAGMKQGQVMVDEGTLVGLHHPDYKVAGKKSRMGGKGSEVYKRQKLPAGIEMPLPKYKKRGMWYKNLKGRLVRGWPDQGFHRVDDLAYEGPKPGSPAARALKGKRIEWDAKNGWWVIV